ncbi:MAG: CatB-related O-acetyltransferase [Saccharofermentanales bacterium]
MSAKYFLSKFIKRLHLPAIKNSRIDNTSKVCSGSHLVNIQIEKYSYIGNFCTIINTEMGKFCSIADNCIIGGESHPLDWVSTSPVFYAGKNIMKKNFSKHEFSSKKKTKIGNDVWIGNNCLIKSGLEIGDGAIIGMGSVLTKDVGAYEIWAGNPAKFIRKRFNEKIIISLLNNKWWEWNEDKILSSSKNFNNINEFIEVNLK